MNFGRRTKKKKPHCLGRMPSVRVESSLEDRIGPKFWFHVKYPGNPCKKIAHSRFLLCSMSLRDLKLENLSTDHGADEKTLFLRSSSASVDELGCAGV